MPNYSDDALISAIERFKKGEEAKEDRKIIGQALDSKQIEIIPTKDSKIIGQSEGIYFGESNEIKVYGDIGIHSFSGFSAEQVLEILKLKADLEEKETRLTIPIIGASIGIIVLAVVAYFSLRGASIPIEATQTAVVAIKTQTPTPPPGYTGTVTFRIDNVIKDEKVFITTFNLAPNDTYEVFMGHMGTQGLGGIKVASIESGSGGSKQYSFQIPKEINILDKISIRMESEKSGYYAYNWFHNLDDFSDDLKLIPTQSSQAAETTPFPTEVYTPLGDLIVNYPIELLVDQPDNITVEIKSMQDVGLIGSSANWGGGQIKIYIEEGDGLGKREVKEYIIPIYPIMWVTLSVASNEYMDVNGEEEESKREIKKSKSEIWVWDVIGKKPGKQRFTIKVFGEIGDSQDQYPREIRSNSYSIQVNDNSLLMKIKNSIFDNLWVILGTSGPIALALSYLTYIFTKKQTEEKIKSLKDEVEGLKQSQKEVNPYL